MWILNWKYAQMAILVCLEKMPSLGRQVYAFLGDSITLKCTAKPSQVDTGQEAVEVVRSYVGAIASVSCCIHLKTSSWCSSSHTSLNQYFYQWKNYL